MALFFKSDDGESGQTQLNSIRFFLHRWYRFENIGLGLWGVMGLRKALEKIINFEFGLKTNTLSIFHVVYQ